MTFMLACEPPESSKVPAADQSSVEWLKAQSTSDMKYWSSDQVKKLNIPQIQALSTAQLQGMGWVQRYFTEEQLQAFTQEQLPWLDSNSFYHLRNDYSGINFRPEQIKFLSAKQLYSFYNGLNIKKLTAEHIRELSLGVLEDLFVKEHLSVEHSKNFYSDLSIPQIRRLMAIGVIDRNYSRSDFGFTEDQIVEMNPSDFDSFSERMINSFPSSAIHELLTHQMANFTKAQLFKLGLAPGGSADQRLRKREILRGFGAEFFRALSLVMFEELVKGDLEELNP